MLANNQCLDALRLSETEQQRILEQLDASRRPPGGPEQRANARYRYSVKGGLVLTVDGAYTSFVVRPRNISSGGMSVLHGSFLYPGARCAIALRTRTGERLLAPGLIVRCRCIRGRVHEVGLAFERPIPVGQFVELETAQPLPNPTAQVEPELGYSRDRVADLARQLQQLATEGASRNLLRRRLAQLAILLQDKPDSD